MRSAGYYITVWSKKNKKIQYFHSPRATKSTGKMKIDRFDWKNRRGAISSSMRSGSRRIIKYERYKMAVGIILDKRDAKWRKKMSRIEKFEFTEKFLDRKNSIFFLATRFRKNDCKWWNEGGGPKLKDFSWVMTKRNWNATCGERVSHESINARVKKCPILVFFFFFIFFFWSV